MRPTEPTLPGKATDERDNAPANAAVVTVRPPAEIMMKQQVPYFLGISAATAGSCGLCMHLVSIPPGAAAEPHVHRGYETAVYLLQGRVLTRYGPGRLITSVSAANDHQQVLYFIRIDASSGPAFAVSPIGFGTAQRLAALKHGGRSRATQRQVRSRVV